MRCLLFDVGLVHRRGRSQARSADAALYVIVEHAASRGSKSTLTEAWEMTGGPVAGPKDDRGHPGQGEENHQDRLKH